MKPDYVDARSVWRRAIIIESVTEAIEEQFRARTECPICGSSQRWPLAFNADPRVPEWLLHHRLPEIYHWYLCETCGNGYQDMPSDPRVAARFWDDTRPEHEENSRRGSLSIYRAFAPLITGKSVLDIGCGYGHLVRYFADAGWEAFGIDPTSCHKAVHEKLGIRTAVVQAENFVPDQMYDVVFSCYAIYFVPDPLRYLITIRSYLPPGGRLCLVVSDFLSSLDPGLPSYVHTFYPTSESLTYLLARSGFRVITFWRRRSSHYFIAVPADDVEVPSIPIRRIKVLYRTKRLRYQLIGKPLRLLAALKRGMVG